MRCLLMNSLHRKLAIGASIIALLVVAIGAPSASADGHYMWVDPVESDWNPPECADLTDDDYNRWYEYMAWEYGFSDTKPDVSEEEIALTQYCAGWF